MADRRDLYTTLGVERSASEEEIRRAYRKLAREHHPDVNPGKPEAEERFKAISAAYDVLSNREKRALYDEFGEEGLRGGFDPEQARAYRHWADARSAAGPDEGEGIPTEFDLGELFGRRQARGPDRPAAGEDLLANVELDFVTALRGTEIELQLPVREPCTTCHGTGEQPGSEPQTCPECKGAGRVQVVRGPMRLMTTCPTCGGEGTVRAPCTTCGGSGVLVSESRVRVRIPPGADDGSELRVRGKGAPGFRDGPPGDLLLHIRVRPHPVFRRDGLDLRLTLPISLEEAYLGASIPVPTLDGAVQLKVPARSQQGTKLRLRGKGVQRGEARGDLYVELEVRVPDVEDASLAAALKDSGRLYGRPLREGIAL